MAFSTTDLTNIESAIASGELTVEIAGRRVTYRSIDDLIKARATILQSLAASGAVTARPRNSYASRVRD